MSDQGFGSEHEVRVARLKEWARLWRRDDPRVKVVIGVAGAGKTSYAMGEIERLLREGYKWNHIGFLSFSRAACREAAERASRVVGEDVERLQNDGWFRTIHSAAVRVLGIDTKTILDRNREGDLDWFSDTLGVRPEGEKGTLGWLASKRLELWDLSRSHLLPVMDPLTVVLATCPEAAKCLDSENPVNSLLWPGWPGSRTGAPGHGSACEKTGFSEPCLSSLLLYKEFFQDVLSESRYEKHPVSRPGVCKSLIGNNLSASTRHLFKAGNPDRLSSMMAILEKIEKDQGFLEFIAQYEKAKRLYGRIDFADILLRMAGCDNEGECSYDYVGSFGQSTDVKVWLCDEYQDCGQLLDLACQRLWDGSQDVYLLGDGYQAVYGFSGAQRGILGDWERSSRERGERLVLNRTWRNPQSVLEWGEQVLSEDESYESRQPFCEGDEGSVGLVDWFEFVQSLNRLSGHDTLIVARTWFNVQQVTRALDERGIPWSSLGEETRSRWDCPAKIAFLLTMRALQAGEKISEQDWRRVTETLKQKQDGFEVFKRGVKSEWAKLACSCELQKTLAEVGDWGAGTGFVPLLQSGLWKDGMIGLLDTAIDRLGIAQVRKPSIRVGTCHSVKGLQAKNVFCLATSTEMASTESADEALCLRYVTITRASANYRLIVNQVDMARGKPQFWAAPKGYWQFDKEMEFLNERVDDPVEDPSLAGDGGDLGREVRGLGEQSEGHTGHSVLRERTTDRARDEATRERPREIAGARAEADLEEWWDF